MSEHLFSQSHNYYIFDLNICLPDPVSKETGSNNSAVRPTMPLWSWILHPLPINHTFGIQPALCRWSVQHVSPIAFPLPRGSCIEGSHNYSHACIPEGRVERLAGRLVGTFCNVFKTRQHFGCPSICLQESCFEFLLIQQIEIFHTKFSQFSDDQNLAWVDLPMPKSWLAYPSKP